jgi:hypothetical protein
LSSIADPDELIKVMILDRTPFLLQYQLHSPKAAVPSLAYSYGLPQAMLFYPTGYTTQEYFERTQRHWFPEAQKDIMEACVTYLSFDDFQAGFCPMDEVFEARLRLNPLYVYAAQNWGYHFRAASIKAGRLVLGLLESEAKLSASTQAMIASRLYSGNSGYSQGVRQRPSIHFGIRTCHILPVFFSLL